jgi:hypothetical protein
VVESILPFRFYRAEQVVEEVKRQAWLMFVSEKNPLIKLRCLKAIRESEGMAFEILRGGRGLLLAQKVHKEMDELREETEQWKRGRRWTMPDYYEGRNDSPPAELVPNDQG